MSTEIKDKIKKQATGVVKAPMLHGHTKIILRDAKTGEVTDCVEKDNLVTNAISDIFTNNLYGSMNYSEVTPLRDMFGGVLCFEDALTELPTNTLPPSQAANKLIAHAGQTPYSGTNTKRGNPNGTLSEVIQDGKGYKFVWDFSTQVIGTISAVSLTNKIGGDIGLTPVELVANSPLIAFNSNKTRALKTGVSIDYSTYYNCLVKVDMANSTGLHVELPNQSGTDLVINEVEISMTEQGINDEVGDARLVDTHNVTLTRSFDRRYSAVCCDDDYMYVIEPSASQGTTLYIDKISLSTWTVESMNITESSLSLRKSEISYASIDYGYACRACISDGYLYWYKSDGRSAYKFNLANTADIVEIASEMSEDCNEEYGMVDIGNGIIVGKNFFINDKVYPMAVEDSGKVVSRQSYSKLPFVRIVRDGRKFYVWSYLLDSSYSASFYCACAYPRIYLGTIQNLNTPVVKTSDKTMQIQYSITLDET